MNPHEAQGALTEEEALTFALQESLEQSFNGDLDDDTALDIAVRESRDQAAKEERIRQQVRQDEAFARELEQQDVRHPADWDECEDARVAGELQFQRYAQAHRAPFRGAVVHAGAAARPVPSLHSGVRPARPAQERLSAEQVRDENGGVSEERAIAHAIEQSTVAPGSRPFRRSSGARARDAQRRERQHEEEPADTSRDLEMAQALHRELNGEAAAVHPRPAAAQEAWRQEYQQWWQRHYGRRPAPAPVRPSVQPRQPRRSRIRIRPEYQPECQAAHHGREPDADIPAHIIAESKRQQDIDSQQRRIRRDRHEREEAALREKSLRFYEQQEAIRRERQACDVTLPGGITHVTGSVEHVPSDGQCLFTALARAEDEGVQPDEMRQKVVEQAYQKARESDHYRRMILDEHARHIGLGRGYVYNEAQAIDQLEQYRAAMKFQRDLWGGEYELEAYSDMRGRSVVVVDRDSSQPNRFKVLRLIGREHYKPDTRPVFVTYNGAHYEPLLNVRDVEPE